MPVSGVLEHLLEYWQELPRAEGQFIPPKAALAPSDLHELLPRIALLKRHNRYDIPIRMMGTGSNTHWHNPHIGMNAFDFTSPQMQENTARLYAAVLDQPCAALLRKTVDRRSGPADVATLYLPLADTEGTASYIISCSIYENREVASDITDRLILDQQNIRQLEYIDLGYGTPEVIFDRPQPNPSVGRHTVDKKWWNRFMPSAQKTAHHKKLDS